jgi:putative serine protease PepD
MNSPKAIATLAAAAVLGAGGGAAVVGIAGEGGTTTTISTAAPASSSNVSVARSTNGTLTAGQVYQRAKDSVAYITANVTQQSASPFGQQQQQGQATGSGFVVSSDGLVVTNAHVVQGASSVTVKIGDGATKAARVVGRDESTDIALLRVDPGSQQLTPLTLADSDKVSVGDQAYAIGNPFGLDRTLTTGIVSALQRQITAPNGFSIDGVIQTDAPINPGNSGGPLLDAHGDVIGVNSQILTGGSSSQGNVGIGFAAPSNTVRNVISQLERGGHVAHAYLGVQLGSPESGTGALVGGVTAGGPAEQGGVRQGDVIVAFDGKRVDDATGLSTFVNAHQVGDRVELGLRHGGGDRTVTVTLGQQPASATQTP